MKTLLIIVAPALITVSAFAQQPVLTITPGMQLQLFGHTNNYYQLEASTNLSSWSPCGTPFPLLSVPYTASVNPDDGQRFFRVRALVYGTNYSVPTVCAEDDNINIPLRGDVRGYTITTFHPWYPVTNSDCTANFNNCTNTGGTDYTFTPLWAKPLDNGTDYLIVNRKDKFWRPYGMDVTVNGGSLYTNIHYIELGRKVPDAASWPIFFVLYCDGNLRLISFPPAGLDSVCFGTSIIVGPAMPAARPMAEIASLDYQTASRTMLVTYRTGGTALLDVNAVSRTNASVKVIVNYPTDRPFCTLRSMYVADGNCDVDTVYFLDLDNVVEPNPVMLFPGAISSKWTFGRDMYSVHNNSAPNIFISAY